MIDISYIQVSAGAAKAVYIPILPEVIGSIPIVVKAQSILAADAVRRQILVKVLRNEVFEHMQLNCLNLFSFNNLLVYTLFEI